MGKEMVELFSKELGVRTCVFHVEYDYIPAEQNDGYYVPDVPAEVEIIGVSIINLECDNMLIPSKWFQSHPGWENILKSKLLDLIDNVESEEYTILLEKGLGWQ